MARPLVVGRAVTFLVIVGLVGAVAGGVASIAGFGIGSFLTPLVALRIGASGAVALVSIPHFLATALRLWSLRRSVDRSVLVRFGIASALGGLAGALGHAAVRGVGASITLGIVLIAAGIFGATGVLTKVRFGNGIALVAGVASGAFGGLVGNQGGVRSAALLAFDLPRDAFVATATAVALIVDLVRMPVYAATTPEPIAAHVDLLAAATAGVLIGTLAGRHLLGRVPEDHFRRVVSGIVLVVGVSVLVGAAAGVPGLGDRR